MRFEKVGMEKLEDLVKTRIQVLRAANKLDGSADMGQTEQESRTYYRNRRNQLLSGHAHIP